MTTPLTRNQTSLAKNKILLRRKLLKWYKSHHRILPWRTSPSLYKTVISEFMLQQTQVTTVLPYFQRWIKTFPDFGSLARASEESVLKQWEGLGYYSRARNLHKLAKTLIQLKQIPADSESWIKFPGIGPYTAAAVTSISFKHPTPVIDGNAIRVLTRLTADNKVIPSSSDASKHLSRIAYTLIDPIEPGDYNQALMELGATLCKRTKPNCTDCPLKPFCLGYESNNPEQFPRIIRRRTEHVKMNRAWIMKDGALLLERIPKSAKRLADIYELPNTKTLKRFYTNGKLVAVKRRSISNQRIEESIYKFSSLAKHRKYNIESDNLKWVRTNQLEKITLSGPHRRWINELLPPIVDSN